MIFLRFFALFDKKLYIATVALMFISLVVVYSLSLFATVHFDASEFVFFRKQVISVLISLFLLTFVGHMNPYRVFTPLGKSLFFGFFLAIIVMLFLPSSLVTEVLGAKRWIRFGPLSIAPTEFLKYGFVFFIAWVLSNKYEQLHNTKSALKQTIILFPTFLVLLFATAIIAIGQKDLGQVVVLFGLLMILLFLVGISKNFFITMILAGISGFIVLIKIAPHRIDRIKGWWAGIQDGILSILPSSIADSLRVTDRVASLNVKNSIDAINNGGVFGQGLGNGQFKLGYLSEVHTDFVLSGLSEELGYIGLVAIVSLLFYIVYRIFDIANKLDDLKEKLFAYGVGIVISLEFLINAYGVSGLIPIKGIAVPMLSYGGSQLMATSLGIAMVLMLSRKENI